MKILQGTVTSLASAKTARVNVTRRWQHPLYKKYVKRSKNYACHVDNIDLQEGDRVEIQECKPISKTKRFKVVKVVNQEEA